MREHRNAADTMNFSYCLIYRPIAFRDIARYKVAPKRIFHRIGISPFQQSPSDVRPTNGITSKGQHVLAGKYVSPFSTQTVVHTPENFIVAPLAALLETIKLLQKNIITAIDAIPKQVDIFPLFKLNRKFNSRNNVNISNSPRNGRFLNPGYRVVVGNGDYAYIMFCGKGNKFGGGKSAVGKTGVYMQVNDSCSAY